jgi:hypothetical protein
MAAMPNIPIMPFLFVALLAMPFRVTQQMLLKLAFALWFSGGFILSYLGVMRLSEMSGTVSMTTLVITVLAAVVIGIAKGNFVLNKTSKKNIERILQLPGPQKPIHVYSMRSWVVVTLMVAIAIALNVLNVPMFWRGAVNLGIGLALITSSLAYLRVSAASHNVPIA